MNQATPEDPEVGALLEGLNVPLDPNAVAACADGGGEEAERARLAADPEAALVMRYLEEDAQRGRRFLMFTGIAAAMVVAGVVLWFTERSGEGEAASFEVQLASASALLRSEAPDLFEGFEPEVLEEQPIEPGPRRGGARWTYPRGIVLKAPKELRWKNPIGAGGATVRLTGNGVSWKKTVEDNRVDAPELGPGRYVVTLTPMGALAGQPIKRAFTVAGDEQRARYERARRLIEEKAPEHLARLLIAHYARKLGMFEEARAAALWAFAKGGGGEASMQAMWLKEELAGD